MNPVPSKGVRCAIYTRKSSEEGLEQAFNSLDAQREACAAYILSQASEGWTALPDVYDDGGLSGGTLERPALQRLLGHIAAGRVDTVVVYKVDRLTRSLLDFSKLVEAFDHAGTSFVSVTQSFNTTTSMGRLTLNMLLSFAQFEREVTAERIRDKIAASKAKGMWMGGTPPLGYAPDGRSLSIVEEHAALVRSIFARYLALGSVRRLADDLASDGIVYPVRHRKAGQAFGGVPFGRGQLYALLANPIYIGEIAHRTMRYPGTHAGIVAKATWDAVQAQLAANRQGARSRTRAAHPSVLAGKLYDRDGVPLIASHATKGTKRYRYYITPPSPTSTQSTRIPAAELERAICHTFANQLERPFDLAAQLGAAVAGLALGFLQRAEALAKAVRAQHRGTITSLIERVDITADGFELTCSRFPLAEALGLAVRADDATEFKFLADVRLKKSGRALRLIDGTGEAIAPSEALVGLLVKAQRWWSLLRQGDEDITALAPKLGVNTSYMGRVVRLAFLSPQIVDAVLAGRTRADLKSAELLTKELFSPVWREQSAWLLPATR